MKWLAYDVLFSLFYEHISHFVTGIGYEKSRQHIYTVMYVYQQNNRSHKERAEQKEIPNTFLEQQKSEKGNCSVTRKKHIILKTEILKQPGKGHRYHIGRRLKMGKRNKNSPQYDKNAELGDYYM
jgi:hypothetical protein